MDGALKTLLSFMSTYKKSLVEKHKMRLASWMERYVFSFLLLLLRRDVKIDVIRQPT